MKFAWRDGVFELRCACGGTVRLAVLFEPIYEAALRCIGLGFRRFDVVCFAGTAHRVSADEALDLIEQTERHAARMAG